jgi:hypothetical protein
MTKEIKIIQVTIFAITMAYLESAVVVYLRGMYGIEVLLRDINLTPDKYTFIEIGREAATIVMLTFVSLLAGKNIPKKIGFFFLSFGVWDIFYYVWLYIFIQWPASLLEWDILFLIPLPWWGPVIAPILISILLISIGLLLLRDRYFKISFSDWIIFTISLIIILYTFVEDSINILIKGNGELMNVRPTSFNWILFLIGFITWIIWTIKVFYPRIEEKLNN